MWLTLWQCWNLSLWNSTFEVESSWKNPTLTTKSVLEYFGIWKLLWFSYPKPYQFLLKCNYSQGLMIVLEISCCTRWCGLHSLSLILVASLFVLPSYACNSSSLEPSSEVVLLWCSCAKMLIWIIIIINIKRGLF